MLGGINLVDYDPWSGDFTNTAVRDNVILGGFATDEPDNDAKGNNFENAIIKYVIFDIFPVCLSQPMNFKDRNSCWTEDLVRR